MADVKAQLLGMGFSEDAVERAIQRGHKTVEAAINFITDEGDGGSLGAPKATSAKDSHPQKSRGTPSGRPGQSAKSQPKLLTAPVDEDAELRKAIELSKREAQEEIQRRQLFETSKANEGTMLSKTEWLKEIAENPEELRRSHNDFTGLRNLGNTCYLNSLLQLYYCLPDFRRAVFQFRKPKKSKEELGESNYAALQFLEQLQSLFAYMALGPEKYVDPCSVIDALRDPSGNRVEIGGQQDIAEFNHLLLDVIEKAFAVSSEACSAENNPVRSLFTSTFVQEILVDNVKELTNAGETNSIIIDVASPTQKDIYTGLDEYAHASVEYRREPVANPANGGLHQTEDTSSVQPASKNVWFKNTAPCITIYTSRVRFDREKGTAEKIHDHLAIEEEIAFDRYLERNKSASEEARKTATVLRERRARLIRFAEEFARIGLSENGNSKESIEPIETAIARASSRLELALARGAEYGLHSVKPEILKSCLDVLRDVQHEDHAMKLHREQELEKLLEAQKELYANLSSVRYKLFAVFVHSGAASSGHYWTYIRSLPAPQKDSSVTNPEESEERRGDVMNWIRFDDMNVRRATFAEVKADAEGGGKSMRSAYGLVYMKSERDIEFLPEQAAKEASTLLPSPLREELSARREDFERSIDNYKAEQELHKIRREAQEMYDQAVAIMLAACANPSFMRLGNRTEMLLAVEPSTPELAFIQALADACPPNRDFFGECYQEIYVPLSNQSDRGPPKSFIGFLRSLLARQSSSADPDQTFVNDCAKKADQRLFGSEFDVQQKLDDWGQVYIGAIRILAQLKCACEATLSGMWARAITIWCHVVRRNYIGGSQVPSEAFSRLESSVQQKELALKALGVVLVAATQHEIDKLRVSKGGNLVNSAPLARDIQKTVSSCFDRSDHVFQFVAGSWCRCYENLGKPEELRNVVAAYSCANDTVSVAELPSLDDHASSDIHAAKEEARTTRNMHEFMRDLEQTFIKVRDLVDNTSTRVRLLESADALRKLAKTPVS